MIYFSILKGTNKINFENATSETTARRRDLIQFRIMFQTGLVNVGGHRTSSLSKCRNSRTTCFHLTFTNGSIAAHTAGKLQKNTT
jgi:hypothetical protein